MSVTTPGLVVAEAFGPTIQGEGPSTGRAAMFIRLGGCNLKCTWCDTPYTWDASRFDLRLEMRRIPVAQLVSDVARAGVGLTVVTGGEPLIHQGQSDWLPLLQGLCSLGRVEVETNGTIAPNQATAAFVHGFNVSPKLAHAGGSERERINPAVLDYMAGTGRAVFKFVCRSTADLDEVADIVERAGILPELVWIMPEGTTLGHLLALGPILAEAAVKRRWNFTQRGHVLLWGNERGR